MKIIAQHKHSFELVGLATAFAYLGHDTLYWHSPKPVFDMMEEQKPQLIILPSQKEFTEEILAASTQYKCRLIDASKYMGVDTLRFNGTKTPKYECDVGFYFWGDIPEGVAELAKEIFDNGFKVKIWGTPVIHSPFYLGMPNHKEVGDLIASCPHLFSDKYVYNSFLHNNIGVEFSKDCPFDTKFFWKADSTKKKYAEENSFIEKCKEILNG